MFNGKRLKWLEDEVSRLRLEVVDKASYDAVMRGGLAMADQLRQLDNKVNALAAALGYEWVPEGKTAARWQKKAPSVTWCNGDVFEYSVNTDGTGWYRRLEVDVPVSKRRNGDKKGGRK